MAFILPESVVTKALGFDVHGGGLLERTVIERLPEIWLACRDAYGHAMTRAGDLSAPLLIGDSHFHKE
ncbi:MAG TPA: hypothetical protein VM639_13235 [Dongiaceae bacterium]|nr:hypothetical protein [Dongiaceae bacterium]